MAQPTIPAYDANALAWTEYHRQMAAFYQWKATTDTRVDALKEKQVEMESRLDEHRRVLAFIPEILERLGPQTLTSQHQRQVQTYVHQLSQLTKKPYQIIHDDLRTAFSVPKDSDILEDDWPQVERWFKVQIEKSRRK